MDLSEQHVQDILHYIYPVAVFVYFSISSAVVACTLQKSPTKTPTFRFGIIWYSLLVFIALYGIQAGSKVVEILTSSHWPSQPAIIGLLACILVFGIEQNSIGDPSDVVWYPYYGSWLIASLFEIVNAALSFRLAESQRHRETFLDDELPIFLRVDACVSIVRFVIVLCALVAHFSSQNVITTEGSDEERAPLILKPDQECSNGNGSADSGYGTNTQATNTETTSTETTDSPTEPESPWERQQRQLREKMEKRLESEGSWIAYIKGFMVFFPYIWPVKNRRLQMHVILVGLCLLAGNGLNFLIPRQYGAVLDSLSGASDKSPWLQVGIFAVFRFLDSEAGIPLIRHLLWMPVDYYSQEALSIAAYSHVMNLSSEFHDGQSSSDLQVAISNGYHISSLLESICFQAVPMVIDLVVAFTYLSVKFGPYEGFITMATGLAFIQAAAQLIARFKEKRKKLVSTFFEEHYTRQAGIQGWHTVNAFNQVPYEESRYSTAVKKQVSASKSIYSGYLIGQAFQYLILLAGLLAGAFLAVYQITNKQATPGDFVMLLTYWAQLTSPLRFFSTMGRNISQSLVQVERLLEVMLTKPTVTDKAGARPLKLKGAKVEFRNVSFSYDKKKDILKGVKLSVSSGTTVAFVGATGAGKSTIFKVLDRFYDVTGGSILIDGQDIRDITLSSLRQCIGIVPQSPILFDDTVINNVRYARLDATDEEVYSACKAAAIHDQIMGFTEGYKTRVGERGVKLSGGELQRLAIARAILKNPEIVLLDEATSAVDTDTEQKIQDGLRALCENRTTFIVAHRLSTVMNADVIFVVANGQVVERGSHEELIAKKGKYAELWSKQIFVKPKETKDTAGIEIEMASATECSDVADEPVDERSSESTSSGATGDQSLGGVANTDGANAARVKTPVAHKKEGSKLNPGAPEFTPRAAKPESVSPLRNSWAEDVEEEVVAPRPPNDGDLRCSTPQEKDENQRGAQSQSTPTTAEAGDVTLEMTMRNSPDQFRPRHSSMSCPEHSHHSSPTRSVSQPAPSPQVSRSPVPPSKDAVRTPEGIDNSQMVQKPKSEPVVTENKPPQGPSRGRGSSRGRGFRGRHRGNTGRGRRNASNPRQTQGRARGSQTKDQNDPATST